MPLKGSSGLLIKPCYDGHTLVGVQQVAGDGLSVISIKESHRNCKFLPDPFSKQPLLSCTQGIKARNSFWNLHKPDLRKLKGLECATTESVTQLFRAHNVDNAGKPTYKKKMLRLLESLVSKKTKTPQQPVILVQNRPWPENICVLSSVCEEREIQITGIKIQEKLSSFLEIQQCQENNQMEQNTFVVENYLNTEFDSTKDTVYISLPSPSNMLAHSSDNAYIGTFVQEVDASNGDSTLASFKDTCTNLQSNNTTNLLFTSQTEPSSFKLTSRKSLLHMSVSSCTNCCTKKLIEDIHACSANCNAKNLMNFCEHNVCIEDNAFLNEEKIKDEHLYSNSNKRGNTVVIDGNPQYSDQTVAPQSPSSEVVQSIFTEMFKEMQDIEDYISSYISSFCSREEEFENYPAINTMSSEVVSHFFEHVRGSTKPKTDGSKKSSLNTMRILKNNVKSNSVGKSNSDGISLRACSESGCLETEENSYTFGEAGKSSKVSECKDENVYISIPQTSNQTNNETNCSDLGSSYTQDASSGYCYWEDLDITSSNIGKNKFPQHRLSATEDPSLGYNKALIPASFFENMWKEFIANVDPHDLFIDLVKEEQNPSNLSAPEFSSGYAYWDGVQDRRIWEEAENIVNSIDNFLTIGCFPNFETFRHDNPCSITEITNDNFEIIANTKEDSSGISQTVTNLKNPEESCNPVDTQLFSYPQQWSEHTSNQSLYREAELDEENVNSEDCQRRRSIFIQCVSEVSLSEADEHRMSDFGDVTYYEYKVPTCSRNCDIKLHMKKSLDQISEENIPTEIFDQTSSSSDKLKTETVITIEPIEPSADSTTVLSRNSLKLEKSETDTTRDRTIINQGNKNKSAELGKNENQMSSNQSSKNIFKDTKKCVDQVCPSHQQCLYTEISEGYVGSDNKNVSSKVSLNRKISNISTNIALSTFSQLELHNKDPNSGESRFVQIPKASEEISSENTSQMVFSSANVQLNLTNPLHVNKK